MTTPLTLHYTGSRHDDGGIVSVVRALAGTGRFGCVLGLSEGGRQRREPALPQFELPALEAERISLGNAWRARAVEAEVRKWLREDETRVFHGHSRAGLLVALGLHRAGERRVVASVHCYGRQKWFYRWAARRLGRRLFWLTPAMRTYYGLPGEGWEQCLPGGVSEEAFGVMAAGKVDGRLRLGGAGLLVEWKRWDLVLRALAQLPAELRGKITFEHIGGPAAEEPGTDARLRVLADELGVATNVKWCGPEPSSRRLLSAIDVLVVPSHREPYSMILQESLAAGVPVLAADSGGPRDVVDARNGRLFPDGDAGALAAALAEWWERPPAIDPRVIRGTARRAGAVADEWARIYAGLND